MKTISVLGDGAWGTAIATVLAHNGHKTILWCYNKEVAHEIKTKRYNNRYLPKVQLSDLIVPVTDIHEALGQSEWIFEAIPVHFFRTIIMQAKKSFRPEHKMVLLSKGIEQNTLFFTYQIIADILGHSIQVAILSGPSYAHDLARKQLTAFMLASQHSNMVSPLEKMLKNDYVRIFLTDDLIGIALSGALKNVISLTLGMLDGAGYMDNPKAFLFANSLHEIALLNNAMGGQLQTIYGLAGLGDLVLTSYGLYSKNHALGKRLGSGESLQKIIVESGGVMPEGINTVKSMHQLMKKYKISLPLFQSIYDIFDEKITIHDLVNNLSYTELNMFMRA